MAHEISNKLGISNGSVNTIIHKVLKFKKDCGKRIGDSTQEKTSGGVHQATGTVQKRR
jgi:hypothetical protein